MPEIYKNATEIADEIYAPTIWVALHDNAALWERVGMAGDTLSQRANIDENDRALLKLLQNFPAESWQSLCAACGMTVYGAVALSWCQGAELDQVFAAWEASGAEMEAVPEWERPARLLNPALLPETESLRELALRADNDATRLAILLAARREPLVFDLSERQLLSANAKLQGFLRQNLARKPERNAAEEALLTAWNEAASALA